MRRISLRLEGFLAYGESTLIEYESGSVTAITGRNGAGKTSIPDAIAWVRFGTLRTKGDPDGVINDFCDEAIVEEVVEDRDGVQWKFQRRKRRARGQVLSTFHRADDGAEWTRYGSKNISDNQEKINSIVGMSMEAFYSLSVFESRGGNRGIRFVGARPEERIKILTSLRPSMALWPKLHREAVERTRQAKRAYAQLQDELNDLHSRIDSLASKAEDHAESMAEIGTLQGIEGEIESAREELASVTDDDTERRIDNLRAHQRAAAAEHSERTSGIRSELGDLQEELGELEGAMEHFEALSEEVTEIEAEIAAQTKAVRAAEAAQKRLSAKLDEGSESVTEIDVEMARQDSLFDSLTERAEDLAERLRAAEDSKSSCVVCDSKITSQKARQIVRNIEQQIKTNDTELCTIDQRRADLGKQRTDSRKAQRKTETSLETAREQESAADEELRSAQLDLREARAALASQEKILAEHDENSAKRLNTKIGRLRKTLSQAETEHAAEEAETKEKIAALRKAAPRAHEVSGLENRIQRLTRDRDRLVSLAAQIEELEAQSQEESSGVKALEKKLVTARREVADLEVLRAATAQSGIPRLMLSDMLSHIEARTDELLTVINGDDQAMKLTMYQGEEDERPTLGLMVSFADGSQRAVETLSNGEVTRVSLALMFAIASVVNAASPGLIQDVFLDEPLAAVDSHGMNGVMALLRRVIADGTVQSVMVVAHDSSIVDACDAQLDIETLKGAA